VFFLYWLVFNKNLVVQNFFLLSVNYFFYGLWDWRFLILLCGISITSYFLAVYIQKNKNDFIKRLLLILGLFVNLGALFFFKYFNFFIEGFNELFSLFGFNLHYQTLKIILPLGISFYIFLSLSYLIDVYNHKLVAETDLFATLIAFSFFPIILSGPVHRPISLIPQIKSPRIFELDSAKDALRQILWGIFMKIAIADTCAKVVDPVFSRPDNYHSSELALAAILFSLQIYADFAGYSNMAIGIAKLLGFKIMKNFDYPYFSRNINEFWKKWHISLTSWFRDYLFLPLAYKISNHIKSDRIMHIKSELIIYAIGISITWLLSGLWHGANITFVFWGLFHGCLLIIYRSTIKSEKRFLKNIKINYNNPVFIGYETIRTFLLVTFVWVFFKAETINDAIIFLTSIFSLSLFTVPHIISSTALLTIITFLLIEWIGRKNDHPLEKLGIRLPLVFRWSFYYILIFVIWHFNGESQQFIYFQF
jgi:D-alanyl-lipoteichoic acid acyltransferase DltB (MBOAT superfamily)